MTLHDLTNESAQKFADPFNRTIQPATRLLVLSPAQPLQGTHPLHLGRASRPSYSSR